MKIQELECAHYVNGGWSTEISSNLNYFVLVGIASLAGISLIMFNKFFPRIKLEKSILNKIKKRFTSIVIHKKLIKPLFFIFLILQQYFVLGYLYYIPYH